MRTDFYYPSSGAGSIHGCCWLPEGEPKAVIQIVHGIAEFVERYDEFACYLTSLGCLVVAEDHMGHGQSIGKAGIQGYFHGGWFAAVEDTCQLIRDTRREYPDIPYILLGHSMGSFMVRTILCQYPDCGITAAIISGTGWMPKAVLQLGQTMCKVFPEQEPNEKLQKLVFGSYNARVEHPNTPYDWLSRDKEIVRQYIEHPLCGFTATAGLMRDMMMGMAYIQERKNLLQMKKDLPVFFVAGGDDPVGNYGQGVHQTVEAFKKAGMERVDVKIYPLCRHEILNEINRKDVFEDIKKWMKQLF